MPSTIDACRSSAILGLFLLTLPACSSPSGTGGQADARLTIALADASGNGQAGRAGLPLPDSLRVRVTHDGRPVAGVPIVWSTAGGAIAGHSVTDEGGMAAASWRLPAFDASALWASARLPTRNGGAYVDFHASSSWPTLTLITGGGQRGEVSTALPVPVRLRASWLGRPVVGESIRWTGRYGVQPMMEPQVAVTDAAGELTVRWTLDQRAGEQLASARLASNGANGPALGVVADADPGAPARLAWGGGLSPADGEAWVRGHAGSLVLDAVVSDRFGNTVVGVPVAVRLREEGGSVFKEVTVTSGHQGLARAVLRLESSEAQRPFSAEATVEGVPMIGAPIELFDLLFTYGPWGDDLLPGTHITVPVGSVVRWGSIGYEHDCQRVDHAGDGGLLSASPRRVLEVRYDQPGTYLWSCSDSGVPDAWLVQIQVTP